MLHTRYIHTVASLFESSEELAMVDSDSGISVRFETKSDLMLATFMLGPHLQSAPESRFIPLHIINSFLQHIRDPAYDRAQVIRDDGKGLVGRVLLHHTNGQANHMNKKYFYSIAIPTFLKKEAFLPKEVTFEDGAAILRLVSGARRQAAEKRSFRGFTTAFSNVILQRTVELLVEEDIASFSRPKDKLRNTTAIQCVSQDVLRSMSLVHRSWTYPSQRAMRIGISVFDMEGLYTFLRSASCGPWLRAFRYDSREDNGRYSVAATETSQLLSAVMDAAPNLEYLTIGTIIHSEHFHFGDSPLNMSGPPGPSTPGFVDIISKLPVLSRLKVLCLKEQKLFFLPQIWRTISALPFLEEVTIQGWGWGSDGDDSPASLSSLPVPSRLENVHVAIADFRYVEPREFDWDDLQSQLRKKKAAAAFLSWLVLPGSGRVVKSLHLQMSDNYDVRDDIQDAIRPALPGLTSLALEAYKDDTWTTADFIMASEDILPYCGNLRSLEISQIRTHSLLQFKFVKDLLSETLECLILHVHDPSSHCDKFDLRNKRKAWKETDEVLVSLVRLVNIENPNLRLLDLTIRKHESSGLFRVSELLPKSSELALRRGSEGHKLDFRLTLLESNE